MLNLKLGFIIRLKLNIDQSMAKLVRFLLYMISKTSLSSLFVHSSLHWPTLGRKFKFAEDWFAETALPGNG